MIDSIFDVKKYLNSDKTLCEFEVLEEILSGGKLEKFIFESFDSYSKNIDNSINISFFIEDLKKVITELISNVSNEYIENYIIENCTECNGAYSKDKCDNCDKYNKIYKNISYALSNYERIADCENYELVKIMQSIIINNPNYEFIIDNSLDYLIKDFVSDKRYFLMNFEKILNEFIDNKLGLIINPRGFSIMDDHYYGKAYRCGDWICVFLKVIDNNELMEV